MFGLESLEGFFVRSENPLQYSDDRYNLFQEAEEGLVFLWHHGVVRWFSLVISKGKRLWAKDPMQSGKGF